MVRMLGHANLTAFKILICFYATSFFVHRIHNVLFCKNKQIASGRKQLSFPDRLLRKFEYRKVMDQALASRSDLPMSFAIVDELIQQGALAASLKDRNDRECIQVLTWADRMLVKDPQYANIVLEVVHTLVEANASGPFTNPSGELYKVLTRIDMRTQQEIFHQAHLTPVLGLLDLIMV